MANTIGTAYINIAPNMQGIQGKIAGGLKGSGTAFSNQFSAEIGGRSAVLIGAIAGVASAAMNKAISVITTSLKSFVNSASEIQSLRASFLSLTGSVKKTNAVMTTLYNFGKQTAFSNQDIQSAGRAFLAVGQDAKQMQESLQLAGDIAGATGANLGQLVLPLTQAYARGTLQTQDFYQILNSGAGALRGVLQEVVKDKTGIDNLGDAMSQGKVTTDLLWEAMRRADKQGGFAFNGAIKQAQTFNGRMSNLREAITQVGLKIIGVDAVTGEVTPGGLFDKISNAVLWLTNNVPKIYPYIQQLGKIFTRAFKDVLAVAIPVIKTIIDFFAFMIRNKDIFAPIAVGIGAVVLAIKAWKTALAIWSAVTKVATAVQAAFNAVMAINPITAIILAIVGLAAALTYFFTKTELGKKIWSDFVSFLSGVWNAISSAVGAFISWFTAHWRLIIAIVLGPLGLLIDFVTAYWGQITGAISTAVNAILGVVKTVWKAVYNAVAGPVSSIWSVVTGTFGKVLGFLASVGGKIIGIFAGAGSWLYDAGKSMIEGLIHGAGSLLSKIGDMFLSIIPGWIKGAFKKALGIHSPSKVFAGYGGNIAQGLIEGIGSNAKGITKAVSNMADNAMAGMSTPAWNGAYTARVNAPVPYDNAPATDRTPTGPAVVQNNNIYNQVDLNNITRELAWQIRR